MKPLRGPRPLWLALSLVAATAPGCHNAGPATGSSADAPRAKSGNIITRDELDAANLLGVVAMVAVQQLRPQYLVDPVAGRSRGGSGVGVSTNGGQISQLSALSGIPVAEIAEIRYFTAGEAAVRFNNRSTGPVILVTLVSH